MKKKALFLFIALFSLFLALNVFAKQDRVFDDAELLSAAEIEELNQQIGTLSEELKLDIIIVTTNNTKGKSSEQYADNYYDKNDFGPAASQNYISGVLYLIDMDNREIHISTDTEVELRFTDREIDSMLDDIYNDMSKEDYYESCLTFLQGVERCGSFSSEYGTRSFIDTVPSWVKNLVLSIVAGAAAVFVLSLFSKTRKTVGKNTYLQNNNVQVVQRSDVFIRTTVSSRRIPTNTGGSGGSSGGSTSTHTSSSGKSHGGGSRKF